MANKYINRCSTPGVIRKTQINTTVKYHHTPMRIAKIKMTNHTMCWGVCGGSTILIHYYKEY